MYVPPHADPDQPSPARVYDYLLGGSYNFAADRDLVHRALTVLPDLPLMAQEHRAFLRRAVRHLAGTGLRQFIDLGSGIPTAGTVHEVARTVHPDCRVVYVDRDPVVTTHSRDLLAGDPGVAVVEADIRRPEAILAHPTTRALLDPAQPVAVLLVAMLHFMPDSDDPAGLIARYAAAVAPGSYLVLSHATPLPRPLPALPGGLARSADPYPMRVRTRDQVEALFSAFPLRPPGLTDVSRWRPEGERPTDEDGRPDLHSGVAGIGRTPR